MLDFYGYKDIRMNYGNHLMSKTPKTPKGKAKDVAIRKGYRSGLELSEAHRLESLGVPFEYEPKDMKISWLDHKTRKYTFDFILENGIIIETKGIFVVADRQKHLAIRDQYPSLDIRFVFSNANGKINKGSNTMYRQWCDRHGFKWANKEIPQSWIEEPHVGYDVEHYIRTKQIKDLNSEH